MLNAIIPIPYSKRVTKYNDHESCATLYGLCYNTHDQINEKISTDIASLTMKEVFYAIDVMRSCLASACF